MAYVQVIQRHAHLAGAVRLESVNGREGKLAKAVLTAISNTRRPAAADGERRDEPTSIQWTLWDRLAESAAEYLGKGSQVNVVGRVRNNEYERDGERVYALEFTAEEVDFLDSREVSEARRLREAEAAARGAEDVSNARRVAQRIRKARTNRPGAGA